MGTQVCLRRCSEMMLIVSQVEGNFPLGDRSSTTPTTSTVPPGSLESSGSLCVAGYIWRLLIAMALSTASTL